MFKLKNKLRKKLTVKLKKTKLDKKRLLKTIFRRKHFLRKKLKAKV